MLARRAIVDVNSVTTGHALRSHATGAENQPGPVPNTTFEIVTRKPWTAPVTALPTEPDNWLPSLFSVLQRHFRTTVRALDVSIS